jgi:tetratricopeptide (TPR) repeat protein
MSDRSRESSARLERSIRRGRSQVSRTEQAAAAIVGLLLLLAPLSGGGILAGFAVPVALAAVPAWLACVWAARERDEAYRLSPVVIFLLVLAALTLLRGSSLGGWMAAPLTQQGWALWPALPQTGALAPGGAASAAVRLIGMALVADAVAMRFGTSSGFRQLLTVATAAALLAMLVGVSHEVAKATSLFGSYLFPAASHFVPLAAPFSNPNVAGSLAGLGAVAAWGLAALRGDNAGARAAWIGAGSLLVLHAFRLEAHGALSATAAALVAGGLAWMVARRTRGVRAAVLLMLLPLLAGLVCTGVVFGVKAAPAVAEATQSLTSKVAFWQPAYARLGEAGLFGFGPGGFHDLGARILPVAGGYRPAFVESEPAQFVFDHGWLMSLVALAVGAWIFGSTVVRLCAGSQRGYAAALSVLTVWVVCDAMLGMAWESLPFALLILSLGTASWRMARPAAAGEGVRLRGWVVGLVAALVVVVAAPRLGASRDLGQQRGRNPFASTERRREEVDGAWSERVLAQARLSPVAPIVLVEEGRRALAKRDGKRAGEIAAWLAEAAPMDESSLAFRINEAEHRGSAGDVCARTYDYLQANNPYLVRPRFWTRLGGVVATWVPCLPKDGKAELAAISYLRREKRNDDALALAIALMSRSPGHLPTIDVAFSISIALRRYDTAELLLEQRARAAGDSVDTVHMGLALEAARGASTGLMQRLATAVSAYPTDSRFRLLRLAAVRELAGRGEAPEGAVALVDEDGRELRLVSGGTAGDFARIGLVTGQAYLALGRFDTAEQQFKLAREETSFRAQAERALEAVQKGRRGSTPRVSPLPQPK